MEILTPQEISKLLKKSVRWVYANGDAIGGVKIGGSWIFTEGGLKDAIQTKRRQMESDGNGQQGALKFVTRHEKTSRRVGSSRTKKAEAARKKAAIRHGLIDA